MVKQITLEAEVREKTKHVIICPYDGIGLVPHPVEEMHGRITCAGSSLDQTKIHTHCYSCIYHVSDNTGGE